MFEDRLNNCWVIKSRAYCWKNVCQNEWFFLLGAFWCSRVNCSFCFI